MKRPAFQTISRHELAWVECVKLRRFPWLMHAFSTRRGGSSRAPAEGLNLGFTAGDRRASVEANRRRFFQGLGVEQLPLASLQQIHSANIYQVTRADSGELRYEPAGAAGLASALTRSESTIDHRPSSNPHAGPPGDALMTATAGILLSIRTADCMPILLVDPRRQAVAAIHAGWRGALACIIEKTVGEMRRVFDSRPEDLFAAIGPSIRVCCYEVGEEVVDAFRGRFRASEDFFAEPSPDEAADFRGHHKTMSAPSAKPGVGPGLHLDLTAVARHQLLAAGFAPSQIDAADYCTACHTDFFFSHRKEGPSTGRMMAVIGIGP